MTVQNLKLRVPVSFPARVIGATGISAKKSGGVWTIKNDFSVVSNLPTQFIDDPTSKQILVFDPSSGEYNTVTLAGIGTALNTLTSTTSVTIGTGSQTFATQSGKDISEGQWVLITSDADPASDYMVGQVTSYDNGSLVVDVTGAAGSGAHSDWTIRSTTPQLGALLASNNLSDLADAATARTNLGLGDSATKNVGTTTGTIAAGDDSRITGAAQKSQNLADMGDIVAARGNLGTYHSRSDAVAASVPASINSVVTHGYAAPGDGGDGFYVRVSTPSTVEAWHFQSADGAYWQLAETVIRPEHFGAKGDDTTDDTAAVQALFDYANAGLPGSCHVPAKSYYCASTISADSATNGVFGSSNIRISGCGYGSILRLEGTPGLQLTGNADVYGVGNFVMANLQLRSTSSTASLLFTQSVYGNVIFDNVVFRGGYSGAHLNSETANQYGTLAVRFNGCTFLGQVFAAIWGESFFENIHVTGAEIQNCAQYAIICTGGSDPNFFSTFTMSGSRVERPSTGDVWPNAKPLLHFDHGQQIVINSTNYIEDGTNNPLFEIGQSVKGLYIDENYLSCAVAGGTQADAGIIKFNAACDQVSMSKNRMVVAGTVTTLFDAGLANVTNLTRNNNRVVVTGDATVTNGWLDSTDSGLESRHNTFDVSGTLTNKWTYPEPYTGDGNVPKGFATATISGGALTSNFKSAAISTLSRSSAGVIVVTLTKAFAATNKYQAIVTASAASGATLTWKVVNNSASQFTISFFSRSDGSSLDPDQFGFSVFGGY